ncbi:hypothetical protein [Maricaulis sp.]|uniref:hypothetical protein n=1 Tax=Maricaulis sp. TaxID=1486257 RepID=UPI001B218AA5|nr:hypothetical protein [Maricaulis sp.]MBO6765498.1 hypothetical protein [Maricaulis sp.]
MSLLPTAHAGQAFGARRIDFFTISGEVKQADGSTGQLRDDDGMDHDVRLAEASNALTPGDSATILRVQAGPNRRSRPAALINHTRETWVRTTPDATTLLARSGVTRGFNWWLSVLLLALTALAAVWPTLHAFLTEMNGGMMAGIPAFSIMDEVLAFAPGLAGWRLEASLPAGLLDAIASLGFVPMDQLTEWGIALGGSALALIAYLARSWRLLYVPAFAAFAVMAGAIFGGVGATLALIGGAVLLFLAAGFFNRVRDAGRFNARVERLAGHVLRNPPQESVRGNDAGGVAAAAATAAVAATALADTGVEAEDDTEAAADDAEAAEPADDAANGEAEAGPELELPPTAADGDPSPTAETSARPDDAGEAEAVHTDDETAGAAAADAETVDPSESTGDDVAADAEAVPVSVDVENAPVTAEAEPETGDVTLAPVEAVLPAEIAAAEPATEDSAEPQAESPVASDDDAVASDAAPETEETEPQAGAAETPEQSAETAEPETAAAETAEAPETEAVPEPAEASLEEDDDLPSLDAVAAAAALSAAEQGGSDDEPAADAGEAEDTATVEDERTMPLASPPPMPASGQPSGQAGTADASDAEVTVADKTADTAPAEPAGLPATPSTSPALDEVESRVAAAVEAAGSATPAAAAPVDDPLFDDDGNDPMLPARQAGDTAPGTPDLDVERSDADTNAS